MSIDTVLDIIEVLLYLLTTMMGTLFVVSFALTLRDRRRASGFVDRRAGPADRRRPPRWPASL